MANPWLSIPLCDYEARMGSAEVRQLGALSELFAEALRRCRPESAAILGIAGGNGLERIDDSVTRRIIGLDVNASYLDAVRGMFSGLRGLELHRVDLSQERVEIAPAELVHAALIFEHARTDACLENATRMTAPGGNLSVVLQLRSEAGQPAVGSGVASMQNLKSHFSFVDPVELEEMLKARGFRLTRQTRLGLPGGKAFWMGIFRSPARLRTEQSEWF